MIDEPIFTIDSNFGYMSWGPINSYYAPYATPFVYIDASADFISEGKWAVEALDLSYGTASELVSLLSNTTSTYAVMDTSYIGILLPPDSFD